MTTLLYVLLALGTVALVLWLINSKYVATWFKVARANMGQAARGLEAANSVKLMQQGTEECLEQVRMARQGLVKVESSKAGLERQVKLCMSEEARLTDRIKKAMADGKTDADPVLVQLAVALGRVRDDLKANREQLEAQHGVYNDLLAQIGAAERRAANLQREAESLGAQLETSKLTAELADFASSFDASGINQSLNGTAKYRDLIRRQIDENNARLKVNRDLAPAAEVNQWEEAQDAKDILAQMRG